MTYRKSWMTDGQFQRTLDRKRERAGLPTAPRGPLDPARLPEHGFAAYTWYCILVYRGLEYGLARWLEQSQDAFTLVPLESRERILKAREIAAFKARRGGKDRSKIRHRVFDQFPWLPGAVLTGFLNPPNWLAIRTKVGVRGVLETLDGPARLRPVEISRLQAQSERLRADAAKPKAPLKPGDLVQSVKGVTAGKKMEIGFIQDRKAWIRSIVMTDGELKPLVIPVSVLIEDLERVA